MFIARSVTGTMRAVKIVHRDNFESETAFKREFEGIQRYEQVSQEHSGLVDVLHVGRSDGGDFYYYVMELADDVESGRDFDVDTYKPLTLIHKLRQSEKLSLPESLELGQNLAEALGKLHSHKLAHRDVKPSNIIYVRNRPRLADPGLVAASGQNTYVGTEGYVPPEGPGTAQADLYSLGMVLYEMNTGKDRMDFPELPTVLDPEEEHLKERRELNTIICRTCAPRPKQRYADAKALGDALNLVGSNRKISVSLFPWKAVGIAALLMVMIAGAAAALYLGNFLIPSGENRVAVRTQSDGVVDPTEPGPSPALASVAGEGPGPKQNFTADPGAESDSTSVEKEDSTSVAYPDPSLTEKEVLNPVETPSGKETTPTEVVNVPSENPDLVASLNPPDSMRIGFPVEPAKEEAEASVIVMASAEPASRKPGIDGELLVTSDPPGAVVFINGEERGVTAFRHNLPAGDYRIRLVLENYREEEFVASITSGKTEPVDADLVYWNPPRAGEVWTNSQGMRLIPTSVENGHQTPTSLRRSDFAKFVKETELEAEAYKIGNEQVVYASSQARQEFCRWLTEKDREKGFLADDMRYMAELKDPLDGSPDLASFAAYVGAPRYGEVLITSHPEGAEAYYHGKKIGTTPVRIPKQEVGPVTYEIRKDGHKGATVRGLITHTEPLTLTANLIKNAGVQFGQKWKNSLGMEFVPMTDILCSAYETRRSEYEEFWKTEGTEDRYFDLSYTPQGPDHPVINIEIAKARAFCEWLTKIEQELELIQPDHLYRLPTDEEWSRMAGLDNEVGRTPEARDGQIKDVFPWGTSWPPSSGAGNYKDMTVRRLSKSPQRWIVEGYEDGFLKTSPVGQFNPNKLGLYDISGNVWEYVQDSYSGSKPTRYSTVMRGGSWADYTRENLMTSTRVPTTVERKSDQCGFRIVLGKRASIVIQEEP